MANRLARETSPYLLQHAHNPVDWYSWSPEALQRAQDADRPILLSIGYSACHWCHVMETESFEDEDTAALMNQGFVNIKVDREERPDLDSIYMRAVQALTGQGGWPLTAFLTPDGRFFYGGTYFPPVPRQGMPSFRQVMAAVLDAFHNRRDEVERGSNEILSRLRTLPGGEAADLGVGGPSAVGGLESSEELAAFGPQILEEALGLLSGQFDARCGGFGSAPKFPQPVVLEFLLQQHHHTGADQALDMCLVTLRNMARGGMRDHLGGGFHRYSVDQRWLVPHFEKMLYDNGLLARVYLQAFQVTGDREFEGVVTSTLDYVLTDLASPEGGFYSSRDADSEGEEGLFYLWRPEEITRVLGVEDGDAVQELLGVTEGGNFEGRNILNLLGEAASAAVAEGGGLDPLNRLFPSARGALMEARHRRPPPMRDEKILSGWNSFVLRALAEAGPALARPDYVEAARNNAQFLLNSHLSDDRLYRSWKDGEARVPAFLEDYAGLGLSLLSLYEATLEPLWLKTAGELTHTVVARFWDRDVGAFFDSPADGEQLVVRPRDVMDNATPSGNSLAVELLLRSEEIFGENGHGDMARRALARELPALRRYPNAFGRLLGGLRLSITPPLEVVLMEGESEGAGGRAEGEQGVAEGGQGAAEGEQRENGIEAFLAEAHARFQPNRVIVGGTSADLPSLPLLKGRNPSGPGVTAYVCRDFTCSAPLRDVQVFRKEMERGPAADPS